MALSIDYALMEKVEGGLVADGDFGWSDVGAWSTLLEIWPRDGNGNACRGEAPALDQKIKKIVEALKKTKRHKKYI